MPQPLPPKPGGLYRAALAQMSPEMRAVFDDVCLTAKLTEDDPVYALLLADAKLLDAFKTGHVNEVTTAVKAALAGVMQRVETIQSERVTADQKQQQLLANQVEQIRRRQAGLSEAEAKSWQKDALKIGGGWAAGAILTLLIGWHWAERRADERAAAVQERSDNRYWQGIETLQMAERFAVDLKRAGGLVRYNP